MTKKPLSKALKTFFGVGDMGFSFMTLVELYFFVYFLTNVAKFSLPMVALISTVTTVGDTILSPFYGAFISGRKPMKWGRNRSWMLIMPPIVVFLYMFEFTRIGSETLAALIICVAFITSHIAWNIAWVANISLIPALASNSDERSLLASRRATWNNAASVFFGYIGMPSAILLGKLTGNPVLGFTLLAGSMAALMMVGYFAHFKMTDGYEETISEGGVAEVTKAQKVSIRVMLKVALKNPPLMVLLLGDFFRYMATFVMMAAATYYFTYVAQNMALLPVYLLVTGIAAVVGAYLSNYLAKVLSTRTATILCLFATGGGLVICKFVAMNVPMFFIFVVLARMFLGSLGSTLVAMYADAAIYGEWKTGENATAFVMGLMNLSLKASIIARGTLIPFILGAVGFVAGADPTTASIELKNAVNDVFLLYPGIFALISAVIISFGYRLTREKMATYQSEIDSRKANVSA